MEDKSIKFDENFCNERTIKGKRSLVISGYLENIYKCCPKCGCIESLKKNGKRTSLIKVPNLLIERLEKHQY